MFVEIKLEKKEIVVGSYLLLWISKGKNFKAKDFFEFLSLLFSHLERFSDAWKFFLIIASDLHTLSKNQGLNSFD